MLPSGSKATFVKTYLLLSTSAKKKVLPLLDAVSDRNLSQMWDQNFTFTFQILKIFFLLYIAKVLVHTLTGTALEGHLSI